MWMTDELSLNWEQIGLDQQFLQPPRTGCSPCWCVPVIPVISIVWQVLGCSLYVTGGVAAVVCYCSALTRLCRAYQYLTWPEILTTTARSLTLGLTWVYAICRLASVYFRIVLEHQFLTPARFWSILPGGAEDLVLKGNKLNRWDQILEFSTKVFNWG